jgi:hypothetical protein
MPTGHFFAWAALGSVGLMVIHDAFFGGRDWDLLSFSGLFCTLWGLSALTSLAATASDAVRSFPGVCCR